ncbi:MAG: hypothetical protein DMG59_01520 [Acidobacteria bacterium]|nr:MAG: hypothetical protein DMG59_01520 [Acidobacteriota bacterium]
MISIRKTVNEMDRLDELQRVTADCYRLAIDSAAHYAVQIDQVQAAEFRLHLRLIEDQLRSASGTHDLRAVQSSFRGELRDYRDKAHEQIARLRREVESAALAMQAFAESVTANDSDCEERLKGELRRLETAAKSDDLTEIRSHIRTATAGIAATFEQARRANQLVVVQLQDEIRALHQEMEKERRALFTDRSSGVWNRQKMDCRIEELLRRGEAFCLLMVRVRNLKRLERQYSRTVVEGTLKALLQRFYGSLGDDAMIGRWSEQEFVAILDVDAARGMAISQEVARKLSGPYSIQENGLAQKVTLQVASGMIDCAAGSAPAGFLEKLAHMAGAISGSL